MGEETVRVDPNEDLDTLIARLKQSRSKDVVLVLPAKQRALQTLDNFYALRKSAREDGLNLTFSGGNKTLKGLAKLLGFRVEGGDDGEDAEMAEFTAGATEQITMPPSAQQRTAAFDGPPSGFVSQPANVPPPRNGNGNGAGRGEAMPPAMPGNAEDFFNSIQDMSIPSIQPPPARNDNGFGGGNDQVLHRGNAANVFGMPGAASAPPPAAPPPSGAPTAEFDFGGGGSGEGGTLSYEEAMQNGFFDNNSSNNLSNDFQFDATPTEQPMMDDDDVPAVPPIGSDNAADRFRRRGVRGEEDFDEPSGNRGRRGGRAPKVRTASTRVPRGRVAMPPALAGLGTRVNKILNPVERTSGGGGMMRADLSPAERERRRRQGNRTTFFAVIAGLVILVIVVLLIVLSLGGGTNNIANPPPVLGTKLNLIYKTTPVNSNVSLLLDTTTPPGTAGQTNPATAGTGAEAGTGGRLPVSQISSGAITTKSDYPAFGSKMQPTGTAQGNVTIINASTQAVGYGAGQVLYTAPSGVSYRLRDPVSVPAGNPLGGTQGRAGGVVVADRAGSAGNLEKGFTRYLSNAVVAQAGAIAGGNEQAVKVVSPDDINGLKKMLIEQAQTQAQTSLKDRYNPATEDIVVVSNGEPNCTTTKNAGDVADNFSGSCTITPQVYKYSKFDLQKAVQDQLSGDPKLKIDPATIQTKGNAQLKNENNRLMLQVPMAGSTYSPVDLNKLKADIANKTAADAQIVLTTNYPQIERIDFSNVKDKLPDANLIDISTTPGDATSAASVTPAGTVTPATGGTAAPPATPKA